MSYIRGKHNLACVDLLEHLGAQGIAASVGHSKSTARSPTVLTVYCKNPVDVPRVKLGFRGYRVYVSTQAEADRLMREARPNHGDE